MSVPLRLLGCSWLCLSFISSFPSLSPTSSTLYIAGIRKAVNEDELKAHFASAGIIINVTIAIDPITSARLGYALVKYDTIDSAVKAKEQFQNTVLHGDSLRVRLERSEGDESRRIVSRRLAQKSRDIEKSSKKNDVAYYTGSSIVVNTGSWGNVEFPIPTGALNYLSPSLSP